MSGPYTPDKNHHRDDSPAELEASRIESRVNRSQRSCAKVKRGRLRPVTSIAAEDHVRLPRQSTASCHKIIRMWRRQNR